MGRSRFIDNSINGTLAFIKGAVADDAHAGRRGFLQARDPRIKALTVLLLILTAVCARSMGVIAVLYGLCLVLAVASAVDLRFFLKRTWLFVPLFSLCIVLPVIFARVTPGEPVLSVHVFAFTATVTHQGLASAAIFFLRVLCCVSWGVLLVLTTRHHTLLNVLGTFAPFRIFALTLGICYRYVYLFVESIQNTYQAIKSRCGYVSSSRDGQRIVAGNIAALWGRSYDLHEKVYGAMLSRGYDGRVEVLEDFCVTGKDVLWLAAVGLLFLGGLWQTYFLH